MKDTLDQTISDFMKQVHAPVIIAALEDNGSEYFTVIAANASTAETEAMIYDIMLSIRNTTSPENTDCTNCHAIHQRMTLALQPLIAHFDPKEGQAQ